MTLVHIDVVPSDRDPSMGYLVEMDDRTGQCVCQCPQFMYRCSGTDKVCKHIDRSAEKIKAKKRELGIP